MIAPRKISVDKLKPKCPIVNVIKGCINKDAMIIRLIFLKFSERLYFTILPPKLNRATEMVPTEIKSKVELNVLKISIPAKLKISPKRRPIVILLEIIVLKIAIVAFLIEFFFC